MHERLGRMPDPIQDTDNDWTGFQEKKPQSPFFQVGDLVPQTAFAKALEQRLLPVKEQLVHAAEQVNASERLKALAGAAQERLSAARERIRGMDFDVIEKYSRTKLVQRTSITMTVPFIAVTAWASVKAKTGADALPLFIPALIAPYLGKRTYDWLKKRSSEWKSIAGGLGIALIAAYASNTLASRMFTPEARQIESSAPPEEKIRRIHINRGATPSPPPHIQPEVLKGDDSIQSILLAKAREQLVIAELDLSANGAEAFAQAFHRVAGRPAFKSQLLSGKDVSAPWTRIRGPVYFDRLFNNPDFIDALLGELLQKRYASLCREIASQDMTVLGFLELIGEAFTKHYGSAS